MAIEVTNLIPALNSIVFNDKEVSTTLPLRNIVYRASRDQIASQLTITYLSQKDNTAAPPNTIGGKWMLDSFSLVKKEMENYNTIIASYIEYAGVSSNPQDLRKKICKKVLFMSLTAQELKDYNRQTAGQIDSDKVTTIIRQCNDDFSGGLRALDVVNYVASLVNVSVRVTGLYNYWIRQYRLDESQSLLDVIRNLYGFYRPLISYADAVLTVEAEPLCTITDDAYNFSSPEYSQVTYEERKVRDYVDGVVLDGGTGLFDPNKTQVKLGQRHKVCVSNEIWNTGSGTTGTACYWVDEFGRKVLASTEKWYYDANAEGVSVFGGSGGGVIKTYNTSRSYNYNSINYEEPILIGEEIRGQEVIVSTDDAGKKVGIGGICNLTGNKVISYDSDDGKIKAIAEHQDTIISPVTMISVDSQGQTDTHENEAVHKRTERTELYHRSNSEVYGVAVAQATETPVFQQPESKYTTGNFNTGTVVDHIETSSETSFQEAFGEPNRNVPRRRKMRIKATSGDIQSSSCNVLYINQPHIIVYSDAERIVQFLNSSQSSVTGNWLFTTEIIMHNDTIYPIGSKLNTGWVTGQELTLNIGDSTLGFDLTNRIIVEGRFRRDDT